MKILLPSVISLFVFNFYSCSGQGETPENSDTTTTVAVSSDTVEIPEQISEDVDAEKFKSLMDNGIGQLIDVRTPAEYAEGHIEGSLNIDFKSATFESTIDTLDKSKPVLVYCQAGGRSGQAKEMMIEKGFTQVYNLIGGFGLWPYKD